MEKALGVDFSSRLTSRYRLALEPRFGAPAQFDGVKRLFFHNRANRFQLGFADSLDKRSTSAL